MGAYRDYADEQPDAASSGEVTSWYHANVASEAGGLAAGGIKGLNSFPGRLYRMLSNPSLSDVIRWMDHGRAWKVLQPKVFAADVLPKYSAITKYPNFVRQVNSWGFRRIPCGRDRDCYYHEMFLRGRPHLVGRMRRPKGLGGRSRSSDPPRPPDLYKMRWLPPDGGGGRGGGAPRSAPRPTPPPPGSASPPSSSPSPSPGGAASGFPPLEAGIGHPQSVALAALGRLQQQQRQQRHLIPGSPSAANATANVAANNQPRLEPQAQMQVRLQMQMQPQGQIQAQAQMQQLQMQQLLMQQARMGRWQAPSPSSGVSSQGGGAPPPASPQPVPPMGSVPFTLGGGMPSPQQSSNPAAAQVRQVSGGSPSPSSSSGGGGAVPLGGGGAGGGAAAAALLPGLREEAGGSGDGDDVSLSKVFEGLSDGGASDELSRGSDMLRELGSAIDNPDASLDLSQGSLFGSLDSGDGGAPAAVALGGGGNDDDDALIDGLLREAEEALGGGGAHDDGSDPGGVGTDASDDQFGDGSDASDGRGGAAAGGGPGAADWAGGRPATVAGAAISVPERAVVSPPMNPAVLCLMGSDAQLRGEPSQTQLRQMRAEFQQQALFQQIPHQMQGQQMQEQQMQGQQMHLQLQQMQQQQEQFQQMLQQQTQHQQIQQLQAQLQQMQQQQQRPMAPAALPPSSPLYSPPEWTYSWAPTMSETTQNKLEYALPITLPSLSWMFGYTWFGVFMCWAIVVVHTIETLLTDFGPETTRYRIKTWIKPHYHHCMDCCLISSLAIACLVAPENFGRYPLLTSIGLFSTLPPYLLISYSTMLHKAQEKEAEERRRQQGQLKGTAIEAIDMPKAELECSQQEGRQGTTATEAGPPMVEQRPRGREQQNGTTASGVDPAGIESLCSQQEGGKRTTVTETSPPKAKVRHSQQEGPQGTATTEAGPNKVKAE